MAPVPLQVDTSTESTSTPGIPEVDLMHVSIVNSKTKLLQAETANSDETSAEPELQKTLPAQWYRDENVFELEKRAIFSKLWLLVSHTSHFEKPGDYISGNYVFDYLIMKDKENNYQAFHNVCRHRAFPVAVKPKGSSLVIGCKYHGWSYNTKGELVKAPKFDTVQGFDKAANSLFKIHTHVTPQGFIFLNFDASPTPVPFAEHFANLPEEWRNRDFGDYEYTYSWQITGSYNWKTLIDGYQECYHCSVGHPGFAKALELNKYKVTPLTNAARHEAVLQKSEDNPLRDSDADEDVPPSFTYVFPSTGVTVTSTMWYVMRVVPLSATQTRMEYDVYRHKSISEPALREFMKFYEQVEKEDYDLCVATQRGLNAGVYSTGILHPTRENGVLFYQGRVVDYCQEHLTLERKAGHEIFPVRPMSQRDSEDTCAASKICRELGDENGKLAW